MVTITKKINLYKFEELSSEAKEKAKNNYIESCIECKCDEFSWFLEEDLKSYGFENLKATFNLSYCQGDGVFLDGYFYLDEIGEEFKESIFKGFSKEEAENLNEYAERIEIKNSMVSCLYTANNTPEKFDKIFDELESNIDASLYNYCKKMQDDGYLFFYDVTDEEVRDFYDANEEYFLEDGTFCGHHSEGKTEVA